MFKEAFLGTVVPFAGSTPPAGWMFCKGQELPIAENDTLFNLIGTIYGGDGITTFAIPDFSGRVAVHAGVSPQMQQYIPGQMGGNEALLITVDNLPAHNHTVKTINGKPKCSKNKGTVDTPTGNYPALVDASPNSYSTAATDDINMGNTTLLSVPAPVGLQGTQKPLPLMSPYLTINYIICVDGPYPSSADQ